MSYNLGTHDVGGLHGENLELIQPEHTGNLKSLDREYFHWEKQVHAVLVLLIKKKLFSADELRAGIEQLEPKLVMSLSYYEKWTMSMILGLVRRDVVSRAEIEKMFLDWKLDDPSNVNKKAVFAVGDQVTVKPESVHRRWRKPHLRIPGYIHGVSGEITEVVGKFVDPAYGAFCDQLIHTTDKDGKKVVVGENEELKQPLYRVKFRLGDIRHYAPDTNAKFEDDDHHHHHHHHDDNSNDFIHLDIFHPWLIDTSSADAAFNSDVNKQFFCKPLTRTQVKHDHGDGTQPHYHGCRNDIETKAISKETDFPLQHLAEAFIHFVVEKNIVTSDEVKEVVFKLNGGGIPNGRIVKGQQIVARAWVDEEFKKELLSDPAKAASKMGIQTSNYSTDVSTHPGKKNEKEDQFLKDFAHGHTELRVVEDTEKVKNLIVCTLCSCYASSVLGLSPDWYKSRAFRSRCVADPRGLLKDEFNLVVPKDVSLHVHDSNAEMRYLVLPRRPANTEGWSEEELQKIVTRDSMIGVEEIKVESNK